MMLRNLTISASSAVMDVWFTFVILFFVKSLYQKRGKILRMKDPGRIRYACNGRRVTVTYLGCFAAMHEGLWNILPPFSPSVRPLHRVLV